jgi:hypothetical protein
MLTYYGMVHLAMMITVSLRKRMVLIWNFFLWHLGVRKKITGDNMILAEDISPWGYAGLGALITALGGVIATVMTKRHRSTMEYKTHDIAVMQHAIQEGKRDRDNLRAELKAAKKEYDEKMDAKDEKINKMASEHQACLLENERHRMQELHYLKREEERDKRISYLEEQLREQNG